MEANVGLVVVVVVGGVTVWDEIEQRCKLKDLHL